MPKSETRLCPHLSADETVFNNNNNKTPGNGPIVTEGATNGFEFVVASL